MKNKILQFCPFRIGDIVSLSKWDAKSPGETPLGECYVIDYTRDMMIRSGWLVTVVNRDRAKHSLSSSWLVPVKLVPRLIPDFVKLWC